MSKGSFMTCWMTQILPIGGNFIVSFPLSDPFIWLYTQLTFLWSSAINSMSAGTTKTGASPIPSPTGVIWENLRAYLLAVASDPAKRFPILTNNSQISRLTREPSRCARRIMSLTFLSNTRSIFEKVLMLAFSVFRSQTLLTQSFLVHPLLTFLLAPALTSCLLQLGTSLWHFSFWRFALMSFSRCGQAVLLCSGESLHNIPPLYHCTTVRDLIHNYFSSSNISSVWPCEFPIFASSEL